MNAATNLVFICCLFIGTITCQRPYTTIDPKNGLIRGDMGPVDLCPNDTWAGAFEFKYEPRSHMDDTCGNGIKLYCYDTNGFAGSYVTSSEGCKGDWQGIRTCSNANKTMLIGFTMNLEGAVGNFDDDLGVIDVRMSCSDGEILDGISNYGENEQKEASNLSPLQKIKSLAHAKSEKSSDGEWGQIVYCPIGSKVCGVQTWVERDSSVTDDAGLCNIVMSCCPYP